VQLTLAVDTRECVPSISAEEQDWLVGVLAGKGWLRAKEIEDSTGVNERHIRAIARATRPFVVSYPGSPGYKLWRDCTPEEIQHCLRAFASQRDDMAESHLVYYRAHHSGFRG
jgi:hypothetical protein